MFPVEDYEADPLKMQMGDRKHQKSAGLSRQTKEYTDQLTHAVNRFLPKPHVKFKVVKVETGTRGSPSPDGSFISTGITSTRALPEDAMSASWSGYKQLKQHFEVVERQRHRPGTKGKGEGHPNQLILERRSSQVRVLLHEDGDAERCKRDCERRFSRQATWRRQPPVIAGTSCPTPMSAPVSGSVYQPSSPAHGFNHPNSVSPSPRPARSGRSGLNLSAAGSFGETSTSSFPSSPAFLPGTLA
ncbi:hypothetical protein FB451DRAFT_1172706 [Mycena latifolia]|nr:hypothetical protein FB451DRAFT_1172706 [Mycena latifolia]